MFALTSSAARRSEGSPYRCWICTILNSTTGSMFNRPSFRKMIEDVEMGYVTAVIVKDMSRLGRDYLGVGYYTETLWTRTQKADHETGAADNK